MKIGRPTRTYRIEPITDPTSRAAKRKAEARQPAPKAVKLPQAQTPRA
jgi:hypothetical protein